MKSSPSKLPEKQSRQKEEALERQSGKNRKWREGSDV